MNKKNKDLITIWIIVIAAFIITMIVVKHNYIKDINKYADKIVVIQTEINGLAQERAELRAKKIEAMSNYFRQNFNLNADTDYTEESLQEMELWLGSKFDMPYKYGAKWWGQIDCSWLFGSYAYYKLGQITYNDLINHYNVDVIQRNNIAEKLEDISRGDFVYLIKNHKATHIMYVKDIDENIVHTIEANPDRWVGSYEYRFIQDEHGIYLERKWKVYDYSITKNNLLKMDFWKMIPQWDFLISSYIPKTNTMDINWWGASWRHTASGLPLKDEYAWKIAACPKQYSIWLNWKKKQKLYIEWYWVVECSDRWGLIVMKWEVNSRWHISSYNRLDLFAWMNTAKIKRGQQHRNVYLIE